MQQIRQCRIAGGQLETIIDFGMQPLGNGFLPQERFSEEYFFPMKVGFCETSCMFQLVEQPAPNKMFHHDYPFFSSTSSVMEEHFQEFAAQILSGGKKRDGFFGGDCTRPMVRLRISHPQDSKRNDRFPDSPKRDRCTDIHPKNRKKNRFSKKRARLPSEGNRARKCAKNHKKEGVHHM